MKSEEGIHIIKGAWGLIEELSIRYGLNATRREETRKEGEGIVELLEEGKAYRQIVEQLESNYGANEVQFGFAKPISLSKAIEHLRWIWLAKRTKKKEKGD